MQNFDLMHFQKRVCLRFGLQVNHYSFDINVSEQSAATIRCTLNDDGQPEFNSSSLFIFPCGQTLEDFVGETISVEVLPILEVFSSQTLTDNNITDITNILSTIQEQSNKEVSFSNKNYEYLE